MAAVDTASPSPASTPRADGLVVGARGCGRRTLLSALAATAASPASGLYSLHLDTKYYTADVALQLRELGHSAPAPAAAAATAAAAAPPPQLQALILVFDAASRASFQALLEWHSQQQEAAWLEECEIRLVVANKMDRLAQHQPGSADAAESSDSASLPAWLQEEARAWCYSNGFEFVAAAAGEPSVDAGLREEGEQQGVARVLSALQAHMWPSMVQKPRQQQQAAVSASNGASSTSSSARDQGAACSSSPSSQPGKDAAPTHQAAGEAAAAPPPPAAAAPTAKQSSPADADGDGDDPFLGVRLDSFEQLMHQVAGVRARLSGLPDDQRRAAAADLALKLSQMMGLPGGGSDDEEGADSEDDAAAAGSDVALAADARG